MRKHSVNIAGHATSISLEKEFWAALQDLAARRGVSMNAMIAEIDARRGDHNLSSALRLEILADLQGRLTD